MHLPPTDSSDHRPGSLSKAPRLGSIDAFRGLVMLLMMAEVLELCRVSGALPESGFWRFLCHHQSHAPWIGCSLHDLIQPSFSFLVGVALPFSIMSRRLRGSSFASMFGHAIWRSLVLVLLGVFLRSIGRGQTYWTFEDTLTQIGLGYTALFLLGFRPVRDQWLALGLILIGYWLAFLVYPLPGSDFDYAAVGVSQDWLRQHGLSGLAAHWQKNSNLAWAFDCWWLNLFPREEPFTHNGGGYATLSFIPTLGTMILGLIAGGWLKSEKAAWPKLQRFLLAAGAGLLLGWALNAAGLCPNVKRIWTPAWTLYSGGWCFLFLALFFWIIDVKKWRAWAFGLIVIGMNSIAAYCIAHLFDRFIAAALPRHLGPEFFRVLGAPYEPFLHGAAVLLVYWLILYWMYRRKLFLKI